MRSRKTMLRTTIGLALASAMPLAAEPAWTLADHLDRVLVYNSATATAFATAADRYRGTRGGLLMRTVFPGEGGQLKPYAEGMRIKGELRPDQFLLVGATPLEGCAAEFVVLDGTKMRLEYGLCDGAVKRGNEGVRLVIELRSDGRVVSDEVQIAENEWAWKEISLPRAAPVLVRLIGYRRNFASTAWIGLTLQGDGRLGTKADARGLSPLRDRIHEYDPSLNPVPFRVEAKPGYDILFYRDRPFLSYASKGHRGASHALQAEVGVNTFYVEGLAFMRYWPEGQDGVVVPRESSIVADLKLCQQFDMPFKAPMSIAHCTPFLPPWLVRQEGLGFEGHRMRKGGEYHASFIKPKTLQFHRKGIEGWVKVFAGQPVVFVFSQEDAISGWDDYSQEALSSWRSWLGRRFNGDLGAFSSYVGGLKGSSSFAEVPYPERFEPHPDAGYGMRLSWLKFLWVQESYGDYLVNLFEFTRKLVPGVPLTQRYVNSPCGVYLSRRVKADYSYTFGHLSSEGVPNRYGIGRKSWTGIFAHAGCLPLPRGGSIGKTYDLKIRRGPMTEAEWFLNAYVAVANAVCGFEYSPFFPAWGPAWEPAALTTMDMKLNEQGELSAKVMKGLLSYSRHMMHYDQYPDVAVFHDAAFNAIPFGGRWSQSKAGIYTLIRETGFHADVLTAWDMTPEKLRSKRVLVLAGSLSIAPEIQDGIRDYVRQGGTLVSVYCADGGGIPGCNGYGYACKVRASVATASFERPAAVAHLGDVLGIVEAGGQARHEHVKTVAHGTVPLSGFNALVAEGRWVNQPACSAHFQPADSATVIAEFDDGAPAAIENRFGSGKAITFAVDVGLIANNLTVDPIYAWWSDLMLSLRCRKAVDTRNWRVHGGAWRDDNGNRVVFLVNLDANRAQTAALPDGRTLELRPSEARAVVISAQ